MVHLFPSPQLLPLHQLRKPQQDLYYLISSHRFSHLAQNLGITGASLTSDFTAIYATSEDYSLDI